MNKNDIREEILEKITEYFQVAWPEKQFIPGQTHVPVSGRVFDSDDMQHLVDAALDFWLTTGRFAALFEKEFAHYLNVRNAILCNSGSSANLLAVSALTSPKLGDRCLKPGDEIITAAAGFPTTVNPIIQNQLTPVFVDIDIDTYNVNPDLLEAAISPRTRAIILAHTLGNPFALDKVKKIADQYGLWLVEDNCDALGSRFQGQLTGTFGDLLITRAGGENLATAAGITDPYPQLSLEQIVASNPAVIVLGDSMWGVTPESIATRPGWEELAAVTDEQVHPFDDNLVSRPGPRLVDGLEQLAKLLHPDLFQ